MQAWMHERPFCGTLCRMAKKRTCPNCGASDFKRCTRAYPLILPGRQINVGRVKVLECQGCLHLIPTPEGEEKLMRCLQMFGQMLQQAKEDKAKQ
jgi:hypothetical protein